jgi:hypothetical protein
MPDVLDEASREAFWGVHRRKDSPAHAAGVGALTWMLVAGLVMILLDPGSAWTLPALAAAALGGGSLAYAAQRRRMAAPLFALGPEGLMARDIDDGRLFGWEEIAAVRFSRFGLHVAFVDQRLQFSLKLDTTELWRAMLGGRWTFVPMVALGGLFLPYDAFEADEDELKARIRPTLATHAPLFEEFIS